MELRYVYRRIEDDIGAPVKYRGHPHDLILKKTRMSLREIRDMSAASGFRTLCMSTMSSSQGIDIGKALSTITEELNDNLYMQFPYITPEKREFSNNSTLDDYDECFRMLDEMEGESDAISCPTSDR